MLHTGGIMDDATDFGAVSGKASHVFDDSVFVTTRILQFKLSQKFQSSLC